MTVAGVVSFDVPRNTALLAGEWLIGWFTPRPGTILDDEHSIQRQQFFAWYLGEHLIAHSRRKGRPRAVTVCLRRKDAQWLLKNVPSHASIYRHHGHRVAATIVRNAAERALRRRRGRPALTEQEIHDRAFGVIPLKADEYRIRLKGKVRMLDNARETRKLKIQHYRKNGRPPVTSTILYRPKKNPD